MKINIYNLRDARQKGQKSFYIIGGHNPYQPALVNGLGVTRAKTAKSKIKKREIKSVV